MQHQWVVQSVLKGSPDKLDYSGFQCSEWTPRDSETHTSVIQRYRQANIRSQQSEFLKEHGV